MFGSLAGTTLYRSGSSGEAVMQIQSALNAVMGNKLTIDGKYGPATEAAVRAYQAYVHLPVDGIVGPVTWGALVEDHSREDQRAVQALVLQQQTKVPPPTSGIGVSTMPSYIAPKSVNLIDTIPSPFLSLNQILMANMPKEPTYKAVQQYDTAIGPMPTPAYTPTVQYASAIGPSLSTSSLPNRGMAVLPTSTIAQGPSSTMQWFGIPWYVWAGVAAFLFMRNQ